MPRRRHKPEEIVTKLRQFDVLVSQGQSGKPQASPIMVSVDRRRGQSDRPPNYARAFRDQFNMRQ
jgi:hypothetical protein